MFLLNHEIQHTNLFLMCKPYFLNFKNFFKYVVSKCMTFYRNSPKSMTLYDFFYDLPKSMTLYVSKNPVFTYLTLCGPPSPFNGPPQFKNATRPVLL